MSPAESKGWWSTLDGDGDWGLGDAWPHPPSFGINKKGDIPKEGNPSAFAAWTPEKMWGFLPRLCREVLSALLATAVGRN